MSNHGLSTYHELGRRMQRHCQIERAIRKQAELVKELEIKATEERLRLHLMMLGRAA